MSFSNNTSHFPFSALLVDVINIFEHCYFTLLWCYNSFAALLGDFAALRIFFVILFDGVRALLVVSHSSVMLQLDFIIFSAILSDVTSLLIIS